MIIPREIHRFFQRKLLQVGHWMDFYQLRYEVDPGDQSAKLGNETWIKRASPKQIARVNKSFGRKSYIVTEISISFYLISLICSEYVSNSLVALNSCRSNLPALERVFPKLSSFFFCYSKFVANKDSIGEFSLNSLIILDKKFF